MTDTDNLELVSLNRAACPNRLSWTFLNRPRTEGRFPATISMGERRIAFLKSEFLDFIRGRVAMRVAA
ncbi:transcriptional regulator [Mesorhizobium hawassense]|uniref:Transcriptional regulator n=1 Tax=Mesorhizobium hawassense TaxID=1209954 RepID=A0A330HVW7_9HYPH|nr:transcriptional regulator [Mesorhizobium hawassense]